MTLPYRLMIPDPFLLTILPTSSIDIPSIIVTFPHLSALLHIEISYGCLSSERCRSDGADEFPHALSASLAATLTLHP